MACNVQCIMSINSDNLELSKSFIFRVHIIVRVRVCACVYVCVMYHVHDAFLRKGCAS